MYVNSTWKLWDRTRSCVIHDITRLYKIIQECISHIILRDLTRIMCDPWYHKIIQDYVSHIILWDLTRSCVIHDITRLYKIIQECISHIILWDLTRSCVIHDITRLYKIIQECISHIILRDLTRSCVIHHVIRLCKIMQSWVVPWNLITSYKIMQDLDGIFHKG